MIRQFMRCYNTDFRDARSFSFVRSQVDECRDADQLISDVKEIVSSHKKDETIEMVAISIRTKSGLFMKHYLHGDVPFRICSKDYDLYE